MNGDQGSTGCKHAVFVHHEQPVQRGEDQDPYMEESIYSPRVKVGKLVIKSSRNKTKIQLINCVLE